VERAVNDRAQDWLPAACRRCNASRSRTLATESLRWPRASKRVFDFHLRVIFITLVSAVR